MPDRYALPLIALIAMAMIALALVWPQGQGRRSLPPFGHPMAVLVRANPSQSPIGAAPAA